MKNITIDGREFEIVSNEPCGHPEPYSYRQLTIKAIDKPEANKVEWKIYRLGHGGDIAIYLDNATEPQAEAIKEAVEALMEFVTNKAELGDEEKLFDTAYKARTALKGKQ